MDTGTTLMELVSTCSTTVNQVIKTMHPQGTSASLTQQTHKPQSLSNMHTNTTAAHSFTSQHQFALNISSSSSGQFMGQNSEQPPASNHPVANPPPVGQSYNLQKCNNQTSPVLSNQTHALTANVAPLIAEQEQLPEKSQANGTPECEPPASSQPTLSQSGISSVPKDKSPVPTQPPPQDMEIDLSPVQENVSEASSLPVPAKVDNTLDLISPSPVPEVSSVKAAQEVPNSKEADGPTSSPKVPAQQGSDIPMEPVDDLSAEEEEDPLRVTETVESETHEKKNSEAGTEVVKQVEPMKNDVLKSVATSSPDAVKPSVVAEESVKEERPAQKEVPQTKTPVKSTPRKAKTTPSQVQEVATPIGSSTPAPSSSVGKAKRQRIRTQHYQSPLPEVELVSKISSTSMRNNDEKLIVFYKNEFLAVRNSEGGFYLCQAVQNIYKSSPKIKIRWLSQDKSDEQKEIYTPDFYDLIDFDCILTNLSLNKADKGKFVLPPAEKSRTESILNRSLAVEKGEDIPSPSLTEEHPDGLDLSLYKDEDQLKKRKARKRPRKVTPSAARKKETPTKKSPDAPKVRKIGPPAKKPVKKVAPKKTVQPAKKAAPTVEVEAVPSTSKSSKATTSKSNSKNTKTSPIVDQKKAKVLARIGKKTAVAAPSKKPAAKNNSKNGKTGNRAVATSSNKTVQQKSSSNGSVKTTTRTSVRKSARK